MSSTVADKPKELEFKIEQIPSHVRSLKIKEEDVFLGMATLYGSWTGNCQIYGISGAQAILNLDEVNRKKAFAKCFEHMGKNLMLIDVDSSYKEKVEDTFGKERIHCSMPFPSTWDRSKTRIIYLIKRA